MAAPAVYEYPSKPLINTAWLDTPIENERQATIHLIKLTEAKRAFCESLQELQDKEKPACKSCIDASKAALEKTSWTADEQAQLDAALDAHNESANLDGLVLEVEDKIVATGVELDKVDLLAVDDKTINFDAYSRKLRGLLRKDGEHAELVARLQERYPNSAPALAVGKYAVDREEARRKLDRLRRQRSVHIANQDRVSDAEDAEARINADITLLERASERCAAAVERTKSRQEHFKRLAEEHDSQRERERDGRGQAGAGAPDAATDKRDAAAVALVRKVPEATLLAELNNLESTLYRRDEGTNLITQLYSRSACPDLDISTPQGYAFASYLDQLATLDPAKAADRALAASIAFKGSAAAGTVFALRGMNPTQPPPLPGNGVAVTLEGSDTSILTLLGVTKECQLLCMASKGASITTDVKQAGELGKVKAMQHVRESLAGETFLPDVQVYGSDKRQKHRVPNVHNIEQQDKWIEAWVLRGNRTIEALANVAPPGDPTLAAYLAAAIAFFEAFRLTFRQLGTALTQAVHQLCNNSMTNPADVKQAYSTIFARLRDERYGSVEDFSRDMRAIAVIRDQTGTAAARHQAAAASMAGGLDTNDAFANLFQTLARAASPVFNASPTAPAQPAAPAGAYPGAAAWPPAAWQPPLGRPPLPAQPPLLGQQQPPAQPPLGGLNPAMYQKARQAGWRGVDQTPYNGKHYARLVNGKPVCMLCGELPNNAYACTGVNGRRNEYCARQRKALQLSAS